MKNFFFFLKLLFLNYSLLRIFQILETKKSNITGKTLEFGASRIKSKNFSSFIKEEKKLNFSNIFTDKKLKIFHADLTKKLKISSNNYQIVMIFNVLEHINNQDLPLVEINRILKKRGKIIGSTPFIYQIHGAPKDYLRFSKDYLFYILKKSKFKNIKVKNLGYGPFVASFSLLQAYLKYIPIFNQIILFLCFIFDTIIQLFVRTKLEEIYPIGLFFEAQK